MTKPGRPTQSPKVAPILLAMAKSSTNTVERKISISAMKGVFSLPLKETFESVGPSKLRSELMEILSDRKRDSTVKGIAAEMLVLHDPSNFIPGLATNSILFCLL